MNETHKTGQGRHSVSGSYFFFSVALRDTKWCLGVWSQLENGSL